MVLLICCTIPFPFLQFHVMATHFKASSANYLDNIGVGVLFDRPDVVPVKIQP